MNLRLRFSWPRAPDTTFHEEFFVGGWHPHANVSLEWSDPPATTDPALIRGANWFLFSSRSPLHPGRPGLVHQAQDPDKASAIAMAFRGYLLDPPIHSYSGSDAILAYWQGPPIRNHNGVFAACCIRDGGGRLELVTDAFGISPLYFRKDDDLLLFATNPRYLFKESDDPDLMAWRCQIQGEFIAGDRSLSQQVRRVPAGRILEFGGEKSKSIAWFDFNTFPEGTRKIDDKAILETEECFQTALDRVLALPDATHVQTLTSGYDSRRIFVGMANRKVDFRTISVETPTGADKGFRELDAKFARVAAEQMGIPHELVHMANDDECVRDHAWRRLVLDCESQEHDWAVRLVPNLPARPALIFDGLGGDVLGESGFFIDGLHQRVDADRFLIAAHCIGTSYDGVLRRDCWPSAAEVRADMVSYLESFPENRNQSELAFFLTRSRRNTAMRSEEMIPAGHVSVFPYLDLDYVGLTLQFDPAAKLRESLQKTCLQRFAPRIFAIPGTHNFPASLPRGSRGKPRRRGVAYLRQLRGELALGGGTAMLYGLLAPKASALWLCSSFFERPSWRWYWQFGILAELVARQTSSRSCWERLPAGGPGPGH